MSMDIYAGRAATHPEHGELWGPVIDFKHWNMEILAEDADERSERGEDPFILNPDYIPNAGMSLSNHNARALFSTLGFIVTDSVNLPIDEVQRAAMRGRNGAASRYTEEATTEQGSDGPTMVFGGIAPGYMEERLTQLLEILTEGRKLGATHICVC